MTRDSSIQTARGLSAFLPYAGSYAIIKVLGAALAAGASLLSFSLAGAEAFGLFAAIATSVAITGGAVGGWVGQSLLRFGIGEHQGWWRLLLSTRQGRSTLAAGGSFSAIVAVSVTLTGPSASFPDLAASACLAVIGVVVNAVLSVEIPRRQAMLQPGLAGTLELFRAAALTLPPALAAPFASGTAATNLSLGWLTVAVLLGLMFVRVIHPGDPRERVDTQDLRLVRRFWAYGWPLVLWILLSGFYQFSDRVLLTWLATPEEAGRYSLLYDILNRGLIFPLVAIGTATNPLVYDRYEQGDPTAALRLNRLSAVAQVAIAFVIAAPAVVGLSLVQGRVDWFGSSETAAAILVYLSGAFWAVASTLQRVQMGTGVTVPLLARITAFAVMNIVLNLMFIPPLGMLGAATATAVAALGYLLAVALLGRNARRTIRVLPGRSD